METFYSNNPEKHLNVQAPVTPIQQPIYMKVATTTHGILMAFLWNYLFQRQMKERKTNSTRIESKFLV